MFSHKGFKINENIIFTLLWKFTDCARHTPTYGVYAHDLYKCLIFI